MGRAPSRRGLFSTKELKYIKAETYPEYYPPVKKVAPIRERTHSRIRNNSGKAFANTLDDWIRMREYLEVKEKAHDLERLSQFFKNEWFLISDLIKIWGPETTGDLVFSLFQPDLYFSRKINGRYVPNPRKMIDAINFYLSTLTFEDPSLDEYRRKAAISTKELKRQLSKKHFVVTPTIRRKEDGSYHSKIQYAYEVTEGNVDVVNWLFQDKHHIYSKIYNFTLAGSGWHICVEININIPLATIVSNLDEWPSHHESEDIVEHRFDLEGIEYPNENGKCFENWKDTIRFYIDCLRYSSFYLFKNRGMDSVDIAFTPDCHIKGLVTLMEEDGDTRMVGPPFKLHVIEADLNKIVTGPHSYSKGFKTAQIELKERGIVNDDGSLTKLGKYLARIGKDRCFGYRLVSATEVKD